MLEGERVILRPLEEFDIPELASMANDEANFEPMQRHVLNSTSELVTAVQENNLIEEDRFTLALVDKESRRLIGSVHVYPFHTLYSIPEIGVYVYPTEERNKGYGFEAAALITGFLFSTRPVPKVYMLTNSNNTFLVSALERYGWKKEAIMRKVFFYAGAYQDYAVWSLSRSSWDEVRCLPELARLCSCL